MSGSRAGSLYLMVLGLGLLATGGIFTWLLGRSYWQAREMTEWPSVPAVVLQSEIEERKIGEAVETDYRHLILYGYDWKGKGYASSKIDSRGAAWFKERQGVEESVASFPVGKEIVCRVNPKNAEMAVLKVDTRAPGYTIWFPLLFVIGGAVLLLRAFVVLARPSSKETHG